MSIDTKKLTPVELSQLPTIDDASGFWVFASKDENGKLISGKVHFRDLQEQVKKLQLERRITLNMEGSAHTLFAGEGMSIYKIASYNVETLKINGIDVSANGDANIQVDANSFVRFNITKSLTDPVSYLFIFAKAINL